LTFVGHSAGSVVAFDFLFYLFFREADRQTSYLGPSRAREVRRTKRRLSGLREMAQGVACACAGSLPSARPSFPWLVEATRPSKF